MKVLNIHQRILDLPKKDVVSMLKTLSTEYDQIWPKEYWPAMKFKGGIQEGAHGGHGPIRYSVEVYKPEELIQFRFSRPTGFYGIHKFEITEHNENQTKLKHTIDMKTKGKGTLLWLMGIRSLHNALIEDGFDKIENTYLNTPKRTEWNFWVKFLRKQLSK